MKNYFENVLRGFIPGDSKVILEHTMRINPDFIVIDVDLDDMPEIVFSMNQNGEKNIGILKRIQKKWYLDEVKSYEDGLNTGIYSVLTPLEHIRLTGDDIDEEITIQELFETGTTQFISMIDGKLYYGKIEFQPLPMMPGDGQGVGGEIGDNIEGTNQEIIDFEEADIKGDGSKYSIYLVGERGVDNGSNLIANLALQIEDPMTQEIQMISLPTTKGYSPYLFVGDFTGDGADEVLVNFFVAPTGGYIYSYIYNLSEDEPKLIFDSNVFNQDNQGLVRYLDHHRVEVEPTAMPRTYRIDISMKDREYLEELYDKDMRLVKEKEGNVLGLVASNLVDYDVNKVYNLATIQTIVGKNYEDILALLETFLKWQPKTSTFEPFIQYVSLLGEEK